MPPSSPSSPSRRPTGALLVLGVFLAIVLVALVTLWGGRGQNDEAQFGRLMGSGKTYYEKGDSGRAIDVFQHALAMNPANPDIHLNLANAFLLNNQPQQALTHAAEVLRAEPGSAAAHYLLGCARLRLGDYTNAVKALQEAKDIDPTVNPVSYQLGRAFAGAGQWNDAERNFREILEFETNHVSPVYLSTHYQLGQSLIRQGRSDEAQRALAEHQKLNAGRQTSADNPALYERCAYTEVRATFSLEQPEARGIAVRFDDATLEFLGTNAAGYHGPFGLIDIGRRGTNDLLVFDGGKGLQLLLNQGGVFKPRHGPLPVTHGADYAACLVADLNTDPAGGRQEDLLVIGNRGIQAFRCSTNGSFSEATSFSGLKTVAAVGGVLADFDFTGKLGLLALEPGGRLQSFRSLGNLVFRPNTATSGLPAQLSGVRQVVADDWNNDDLPDVMLVRDVEPPLFIANQRGGAGFAAPVTPPEWPVARAMLIGDFNNDLRADAVFLTPDSVTVQFGGLKEPRRIPAKRNKLTQMRAMDFDNDGWLDLVAWGADGIRLWRNRGRLGFLEVTSAAGLGPQGRILHLAAADLDNDGDTDLVVDVEGQGTRILRNHGGNANQQLKLRFFGNRSNPSGIGVKVEVAAGGWHALRSITQLPAEIGIGSHKRLDVVSTRWFDTRLDTSDVDVHSTQTLDVIELTTSTGSCPNLYAWDGRQHRFVTDLLGASPLGLPVAEGRYIEADPEELVRVGDASQFIPRNGRYVLQITEELREVLYLDTAQLLVVDHPPTIAIQPTSKLLPGPPFPKHELIALGRMHPLLQAVTGKGEDVTAALKFIDGIRVSPEATLGPQLRGLAQPGEILLDFGPLPAGEPLALALTGWLRFGGGMANIGASHRPDLPFPFPTLWAETGAGDWKQLDIRVGAPAGKTKSIVVNLTGALPEGARRLKITQGFEIHWDQIALYEPLADRPSAIFLNPSRADLHWRGYSTFADLPWTAPPTPVYDDVRNVPPWRITPGGWATRYGAVDELLRDRDDGLVLVAGGDELTLEFDASGLPPLQRGFRREFFLRTIGWDKDADYHVAEGWRIEPLPWSGMDYQAYGRQARPKRKSDELHQRFNTRWVGPMTYARRR